MRCHPAPAPCHRCHRALLPLRVPGNTSPAHGAVTRTLGKAVSILSPSFPHLPVTPAQGLVLSVGMGRSDCSPAQRGTVPKVPSGETAANPIFGVGMKMLSQAPTLVWSAQPPQSRTLSAQKPPAWVSNAAYTAQPSSPFPGISVTTKTQPLELSPHISQRSFLWSPGGRDVQGRQDRKHESLRGGGQTPHETKEKAPSLVKVWGEKP